MKRRDFDIRLLRIAEDDLTEIVNYIFADRPSAAEELAAKIEKNLILLSKNPHLGRIPKENELALMNYRYLVIDNYLLFYTIEKEVILVHRILHGAQDYLKLL